MTPVLTHIALHCRDLDRSRAFYEQLCGMRVVHKRCAKGVRVLWLAHPGKETEFVIVLIEGGKREAQDAGDFSHMGLAMQSKADVDKITAKAEALGYEVRWRPSQSPAPVGYICGVADPDGHMVEFSFGQPLGPGAEKLPLEEAVLWAV
jgi:catechol 2,3-dioxygenase-like lactoylglutathione lyase family enzyme